MRILFFRARIRIFYDNIFRTRRLGTEGRRPFNGSSKKACGPKKVATASAPSPHPSASSDLASRTPVKHTLPPTPTLDQILNEWARSTLLADRAEIREKHLAYFIQLNNRRRVEAGPAAADEPLRRWSDRVPISAGRPEGARLPIDPEKGAVELERTPKWTITCVEPKASFSGCAKHAQNTAQPFRQAARPSADTHTPHHAQRSILVVQHPAPRSEAANG